MKNIFLIASGCIFLLFAYFQLNDPDPIRWVPIYLLPAILAFKELLMPSKAEFLFGLSIGYLVAAVLQWPPAFEGFLFGEMKMRSLNIELARESGGLLIAALALFLYSKLTDIE
jgi:hypothetical protein